MNKTTKPVLKRENRSSGAAVHLPDSRHRADAGDGMKGHRVMVRDLTTGKVYSSMREASLYMPVCQESLSDAYSTKKSECCGIPVEFMKGRPYE